MEILILFLLVGFGGWLLGIIGFFRAGQAQAELRDLRRLLTQPAVRQVVPTQPVAAPRDAAPVAAFLPPPTVSGARFAPVPPVPTVPPVPLPPAPVAGDLEALLTLRWGVWLGAASLVFAGIFLVRYAVERALLGPGARCALAALLGVALLGGAEFLFRRGRPAAAGPWRIDQSPGALAAGGVAVLFGAAYGAGPFYGLLGPTTGFVALAAASFAGLAAALRFGQLTAAVGLVGSFLTPALVATDTPSLAGLFAYLFLATGAALYVLRRTAWTWLGWATTAAGAVWVCVAAVPDAPDAWAAAFFVPAAALLNLVLLPGSALGHPVGRRLGWVPFAALGTAGLFLACVAPGTAPRAALFLLSPIAIWQGAREPRLDRLPWLAATFGLLTLLLWALPIWHPSPAFTGINGVIQAVLPGTWAPQVIRPLLLDALLLAAMHAAAGVWGERRAANPAHWAALVAAVPLAALAVTYAQIERFQTDPAWALAAASLAAALTGAAASALRRSRQLAGIHAAGAAAALALGCAMVLHDHWLTLAVTLFLPALAWIEARADLPPLRRVAHAVAALVLVRLLLNWYVLDYAFGATPVGNGLVAAYAAPAAAFLGAAWMFRHRADDALVATLQAGGVGLFACFVALEIRHGFGGGRLTEPLGFAEAAWHVVTLGVQALVLLRIAVRTDRPVLQWAWRLAGGLALAGGCALLLLNPAFTDARDDSTTLLVAYLVPAVLAVVGRRRVPTAQVRDWLGYYAVAAGFVWLTLQIRDGFHPWRMGFGRFGIEDGELWAWSGAWLAYGIALLLVAIRVGETKLRPIALGIIGLVCGKVFLVDMANLTGLWRVLSFLGLGLALIGLGAVYRRLVLPARTG